MIEKYREYGVKMFMPTCDSCGALLPPEQDFDDAVCVMREEGWITRKDPLTGEWVNFCPKCAHGMRLSAADDFAGIV